MSGYEEHDAEYGLVMPFVVCASQGGPYEDDAFVAGYEMGSLDALLAQQPAAVVQTLRTASVPQMDLIAMRHGFVVRNSDLDESGEWTTVTLTQGWEES